MTGAEVGEQSAEWLLGHCTQRANDEPSGSRGAYHSRAMIGLIDLHLTPHDLV